MSAHHALSTTSIQRTRAIARPHTSRSRAIEPRASGRASAPDYRTSLSASRRERAGSRPQTPAAALPWRRAATSGEVESSCIVIADGLKNCGSTSPRTEFWHGGTAMTDEPSSLSPTTGRGGGCRQRLHERQRPASTSSEQITVLSWPSRCATRVRIATGLACGAAHAVRRTMTASYAPPRRS